MSRKYLGLIVLSTKSQDGSVDDLVTSISKDIESQGAKIGEIKQLGRKEFAYNARHLDGGHYVEYQFECDPETISDIQTKLQSNKQVHLQHYKRV